MNNRWLLPEYIEDVLPEAAWQVEDVRAKLLSLFKSYGYELVIPPHVEYIESLTGIEGDDLNLKTFKLVDQITGRQLGLRADMTPQVARIDAHLLNRMDVTRLCYAGHVVHTLPAGHFSTREPLQVGAEIYGSKNLTADIEIIELMSSALKVAGISEMHVDIGHVGIFRTICELAKASPQIVDQLFTALQTKDLPSIAELTINWEESLKVAVLSLPSLFGEAESVLATARLKLPTVPAIQDALETIERVCVHLATIGVRCSVELGELRTGFYHNGLVFTAFAKGWSNPVARGGRYDNIGQQFGRARAATGFSIDLRDILRGLSTPSGKMSILAPDSQEPELRELIAKLRESGEIVRVDISGGSSDELAWDRKIVKSVNGWEVVSK